MSPRSTTIMPRVALDPEKSIAERLKEGKLIRDQVPRHSHAVWKASPHRRNPIDILIESSKGRIPELLPIRYGRMVRSPFTFYRGAAAIMAADLAKTPVSGIFTQICGDCHLLNFGGFATPERKIIFDVNDFDETLPGPWEWDLKRLVTSFVIASRQDHFTKDVAREAALTCARSYRKHMAEYSLMKPLEVWYACLDVDTVIENMKDKTARRNLKRRISRVIARDVKEEDYPKLAESSRGKNRIKDNPPLIYHPPESFEKDFEQNVRETYKKYINTLLEDRRILLKRYLIQDVAIKVVGVGSVGTWCGIVLLMARGRDPLFLQVKEARASVLEPYLGKSAYSNHGQRVVSGQRLMQSASDIFLGWTVGKEGRHFYIRRLRDMKIKPQVEIFHPDNMIRYAKFCGWTLARAHAKSGDPALISGYLGKANNMDRALLAFAEAYADQNEKDHQALLEAVNQGRIRAYLER